MTPRFPPSSGEASEDGLGFVLPPPPVVLGGIAFLVWLFAPKKAAARVAVVEAKIDPFKPETVAAAIDKAVAKDVKKLEVEKKAARKKVSKALEKAEKKAPNAKKKVIVEAKVSIDKGKPNKKKIDAAKKDNKSIKKSYDDAVKNVRKLKKDIEKKVNKIKATAELAAKVDIDEIVKVVPKELRGVAEDAFRSIKSGKADLKALKKLGPDAKKFMNEYTKKFGVNELAKSIPDLPSNVPAGQVIDFLVKGDFSVKAIGKAGFKAGSDIAEKQLSAAVGFPIELPDELTAKALVKSLLGPIPTDLNQAIDLGLQIGAQAVASALTAALAGTAIGSVIPGLGTIVGLGVGLLAGALSDELKEEPPPHLQKCPTKYKCPKVPKLSPIELIPWLAKEHAKVSSVVARDQARKYCGVGASVACSTGLSFATTNCYYVVFPQPEKVIQGQRAMISPPNTLSTIEVIGLPEVNRLIKLYEDAPIEYEFYDTKKKKLSKEKHQYLVWTLERLKKRKGVLKQLVDECKKIETIPNLPPLRFRLITEATYAAQQVYFNPTKESKDWLKELGGYVQRLEKREKAINTAAVNQMKEDERVYQENIKRDPSLANKTYSVI